MQETPQYTAYRAMFDQVKINGIRFKLVPRFQPGQDTTFNATARGSVVYAWDRNGISDGQNLTYKSVSSYGSAISKAVAPGTSGTIVTSIYATDLIERCSYFNTSAMQPSGDGFPTVRPFGPDFILCLRLPSPNPTDQI